MWCNSRKLRSLHLRPVAATKAHCPPVPAPYRALDRFGDVPRRGFIRFETDTSFVSAARRVRFRRRLCRQARPCRQTQPRLCGLLEEFQGAIEDGGRIAARDLAPQQRLDTL